MIDQLILKRDLGGRVDLQGTTGMNKMRARWESRSPRKQYTIENMS